MDALIVGLIWVLIAALVVVIVCWIVTRLIVQFLPGGSSFTWIIWGIGGLVLLLFIIRTFVPHLPGA